MSLNVAVFSTTAATSEIAKNVLFDWSLILKLFLHFFLPSFGHDGVKIIRKYFITTTTTMARLDVVIVLESRDADDVVGLDVVKVVAV